MSVLIEGRMAPPDQLNIRRVLAGSVAPTAPHLLLLRNENE